MSTLTDVASCTISDCAYNSNGCTAPAVTITGSPEHATCGTYIALDVRGGLPVASAQVGACQRVECVHNSDLLCTASSVTVGAGADTADCLTYEAR